MANEENTKVETMKLDDTQRVKVLSPSALVLKRFFRNRLAIVGMVIIILMFLFSFVGGMVIPYGQSQVFYTTEEMKRIMRARPILTTICCMRWRMRRRRAICIPNPFSPLRKTSGWWKRGTEVSLH